MSFRIIVSCLFVFTALCSGEFVRRSDLANDKEVDETFITSSRETRNFSGIDIPKILEATNPDIIYKARSVIKNERMKMEMRSQNSEQQIKNENGGRSYSAHSRLYDISQSLPVADEKEQRQQKQEFTAQTLRRRTTETCEGVRKIVTCKKDTSEETCKKNLLAAGVVLVSDMPNTPFFAVCIDAEERALVLAGLSDVASVEDDPLRTLSYIPTSEVVKPMQTSEQVIPYGVELVKAPEFWDMYGKRGEGMKVCVIDSGLRTTHEDLIAGDLSGSSDSSVVTPWDGFSGSHGTHVTGTIAAQDNTVGVVGVAPDASIYVVRIFSDSGSASASIFMQGLNACARAGVNIINMSLGGPGSSTAERNLLQSLKDSGILLVAAAGNTASTNNRVQYPAGYESVMSVGAIDENLEIAIFSSHNNQVDIVAPGVGVLSTTAARDTSYSQYDGTSMAAPHIAGVAALLWSQFPEKSVDEIQNALSQSAQDLGACGRDRLFGHGVVDVMAAAAYLENGGVAATELESCVDVTISLTTDDWGQDTFFFVVPEDNIENTIYRGGPYVNGRRATYTENIQLPDGCYFLLLLDRFGDGTNNPENGIGKIELSYNGTVEVNFGNFTGVQEWFPFGNCIGDNSSSVMAFFENSTSYLLPDPILSPSILPLVDGCDSGELLLEMALETDSSSQSENQLYLSMDVAVDEDWVWSVNQFELENNRKYVASACLVPTNCYTFFFFDEMGDGLTTGAMTLMLNEEVVLQIRPGDTGLEFQENSAASFWYKEFGTCTSVSTSSLTNNGT